jgi:Fur family ferric uptake transcriptional regulator
MKKEDHANLSELVVKKMKESGLRLTQSRLKILQLLEGTQKSLSPSEIFTQVKKKFKGEDFDRVTVYRIIEKFEELEIVHAVGDGKYIYCTHQACGHDKHFLAICDRCGTVQDVGGTAKTLQVLADFLEKEAHFLMTNDSIVIRGLCQKCSKS